MAEPGEVLPAGGKVLSLADLSDVYMYVFLPANGRRKGRIGFGSAHRARCHAGISHSSRRLVRLAQRAIHAQNGRNRGRTPQPFFPGEAAARQGAAAPIRAVGEGRNPRHGLRSLRQQRPWPPKLRERSRTPRYQLWNSSTGDDTVGPDASNGLRVRSRCVSVKDVQPSATERPWRSTPSTSTFPRRR